MQAKSSTKEQLEKDWDMEEVGSVQKKEPVEGEKEEDEDVEDIGNSNYA